ncbi:MAG: hypothetical protein ACRECP_08550 [Methylocella sp.]
MPLPLLWPVRSPVMRWPMPSILPGFLLSMGTISPGVSAQWLAQCAERLSRRRRRHRRLRVSTFFQKGGQATIAGVGK